MTTPRPSSGSTIRPGAATTDSLFLDAGRTLLTETLIDACTIRRQTGATESLITGTSTPAYATIYAGPCKVQGAAAASSTDVAEAHLALDSPILHVPITVTGVQEGDLVTITASANDPELPGRFFRIQGPHHKSNATARRFQCTEVTG